MVAVVSENYCSLEDEFFIVRKRTQATVNGGGFVVMDKDQRETLFRVEGPAIHGYDGRLILRDISTHLEILTILCEKPGRIIQFLNNCKKWNGYSNEVRGGNEQKLVFSFREPPNLDIQVSVELEQAGNQVFKIVGSFPRKDCRVYDHTGRIIAEIIQLLGSEFVYQVIIYSRVDKAFVFGVIGVLDYINNESTTF